jgi:hypothetical protein
VVVFIVSTKEWLSIYCRYSTGSATKTASAEENNDFTEEHD